MPNEFIARNGLIALNNTTITGSFTVGAFTSSFAGNVLIGTTTDAGYKLDVNGTARVQDALTVTTGTTKGINFAGTKIVEATNDNAYTQLLIQPNSGNKDAVFQFAPSGTKTASVMEFYGGSNTALSTNRFIFKNNNSVLQIGGDGAALPITFISNNVETARIFSNGNVAIGTTTDAGFKLDVSGSTRFNGNSQITGSIQVTAGITGSLLGTASTASFVNPLVQNVLITGSLNITGSENVRGSGSAVFSVDGTSGRLFQVDDSLSGSLFSVNTAGGLPVMEAFSDNTVRIGQYGQRALFVSQSRVGIGKESALSGVLDVSGSTTMTGSLNVSAGITGSLFGTASWAQNAVTSSYILNAVSASFASTASSVNPLNQNVIITGSLTVNGTSATIKSGNNYGSTTFSNGSWGYARVGAGGEPTIAMVSNVQNTLQTLDGVTIPATGSALIFSSAYGYNIGNDYNIISVGKLGVRVNNTTQALTIPTSGIVTANQGLIVSGSLTVITGSAIEFQVTDTGIKIGNASTDTHTVTGSLNITGSITTTGTITAQTLVVQTITSSVSFMTGSTRFGSLLANTHQFTGSVSMTGSLTTVGTASFDGNVGIGTTTPSSSLEINKNVSYTEIIGSANNPAIRIKNTNSANFNEKAEVQFTIGNSVLPTAAISNLYTSYTAGSQQGGDLVFSTRTAGSTLDERMRILYNGNVGIGTTSPASLLQVNGTVTITGDFNSNTTNGLHFGFASNIGKIFSLQTSAGWRQLQIDGSSVVFNTNGGGGNVGIGTTSPSNLFEVNGISAVVNSFGAFTALQASGSTGYRWTLANDASFRLQYTTNGFSGLAGTPLYVSSSGNIGIGTTSPGYPLVVSGNVSDISIYASNDIVAYSDQSVKTNLEIIPNAIDKIKQINGYTFERTDNDNKRRRAGVIAQEVEKVLPEVIAYNNDGTLGVAYGNMVALLIECIKEQQIQIDELKSKING